MQYIYIYIHFYLFIYYIHLCIQGIDTFTVILKCLSIKRSDKLTIKVLTYLGNLNIATALVVCVVSPKIVG